MSVRPSICFVYEKKKKHRGNRAASASVYFNSQRSAIVTSGAGRHGWLAQTNRHGDGGVFVVCVCVCVHAFARVRACVRACVRDVFAIYDTNI